MENVNVNCAKCSFKTDNVVLKETIHTLEREVMKWQKLYYGELEINKKIIQQDVKQVNLNTGGRQ